MRPIARCGTRGGYSRHTRLNERPCPACVDVEYSHLRSLVDRRPRRAVVAAVDEVAVMRAAGGERIRLHPAERTLAVQQLKRHGLPYRTIAARLHCSVRTVERHGARAVA